MDSSNARPHKKDKKCLMYAFPLIALFYIQTLMSYDYYKIMRYQAFNS